MVDLWVYITSWKDQDAAQDITTVQGRTMQCSGKQRDLQHTESHIVGDESTEDCSQKTKRWCHKEFSARATYAFGFRSHKSINLLDYNHEKARSNW